MLRTWCVGLLLVIGCSRTPDSSESARQTPNPEPVSKAAAVKQQAEALRDATARHDYAGIIDRTYPGVVAAYGGREAAIRKLSAGMEKLKELQKEKGFSDAVATIGDPGEFYTEGANIFVVVPTYHEVRVKGGTVRSKAYFLGISSDGGQVWTFIDAGGFQDAKFRDQVLPKLPSGMVLPELGKGEVIPDK